MRRKDVRVNYGPSAPAIGDRLLEQVAGAASGGGGGFLFLVATRFRRRLLERRLAAMGSGFFDRPVLTLSDLVRAYLKQLPESLELLDDARRRGLLAGIVGLGESGQCDFPRHQRRMTQQRRFIGFFKARNIRDGAMLRLHFDRLWTSGPEEDLRIRRFEEYQRRLEKLGLEDWEGALGRLYDDLLTGRFSPTASHLILEPPPQPTLLESGVLRLLVQRSEEIDVVLEAEDLTTARKTAAAVPFLDESELDYRPWERKRKPVQAMVFNSRDRRAEVERAADVISRRLERQEQLPPADMAVVAAQPYLYRSLVDETFAAWGLPVAFLRGRATSESATVQTLLRYLDVLESDFSRDCLFDFLASPSFRNPLLSAAELRRLEKWSEQLRIDGGLAEWLDDFPARSGAAVRWAGLQTDDVPAVAAGLKEPAQLLELIERFTRLLRLLSLPLGETQALSLARWSQVVRQKLEGLVQLPALDDVRRLRRENLLLERFLNDLSTGCNAAPVDSVPFAFFRQWCLHQARRSRRITDSASAGIWFGSPEDIRHLALDTVVWLGMVEGEFPTLRNSDFPPQAPGEAPPSLDQRFAECSHTLHSIRRCTHGAMVFIWPRVIRDSLAQPSSLLSSLPVEPAREVVYGPSVPNRARAKRLRRGLQAQNARESRLKSPWQGSLSRPFLLEEARARLFPENVTVTPTQLEGYVQCGYRYFLQELLQLNPAAAPTEELSSLEMGRLLHRVVARFFGPGYDPPRERSASEGQGWMRSQFRRIDQILDQEIERIRPAWSRKSGVLIGFQLRALREGLDGTGRKGLLAHFVSRHWKQRRSSRVVATELSLPPAPLGSIPDEGGGLAPVQITGRIDRLDRRTNSLVVVDYKTAANQPLRLYQGWGFQLPLYLDLAAAANPNQPVRGAFYLLQLPFEPEWREPVVRDQHGVDPTLGKLRRYYRSKALHAVRNLLRGEFPVTLLPPRQAGCPHCPFRLVCRYHPERAEALRRSGSYPAAERVVSRGRWVGPGEVNQ